MAGTIDQAKRAALIAKIEAIGWGEFDGPVVSLEDFFEGNGDPNSIMCNVLDGPPIQEIYKRLCEIRDRPEVKNMLVQIYETMDDDPDCWPFAELVLVYTSAGKDDVRTWFEPLLADDILEFDDGLPPGAPEAAKGVKVWGAWWD